MIHKKTWLTLETTFLLGFCKWTHGKMAWLFCFSFWVIGKGNRPFMSGDQSQTNGASSDGLPFFYFPGKTAKNIKTVAQV
jgi:hypothetical protein